MEALFNQLTRFELEPLDERQIEGNTDSENFDLE